MKKSTPKIINDLIDFFKYWDNPDNEKDEYKSIKMFQTSIYIPSNNFIFKWIITKDEMKQVSEYMKMENVNDVIWLSLCGYNIELSSKTIK